MGGLKDLCKPSLTCPTWQHTWYVHYPLLFAVFQDLTEDPPVHRVRGDLGGPGPGRGHLQADRHQQGAGRSQFLCAEKTVWRGEGHNTNVHVSITPKYLNLKSIWKLTRSLWLSHVSWPVDIKSTSQHSNSHQATMVGVGNHFVYIWDIHQ